MSVTSALQVGGRCCVLDIVRGSSAFSTGCPAPLKPELTGDAGELTSM